MRIWGYDFNNDSLYPANWQGYCIVCTLSHTKNLMRLHVPQWNEGEKGGVNLSIKFEAGLLYGFCNHNCLKLENSKNSGSLD